MNSKHTPTPWRLNDNNELRIAGPDGIGIASTHGVSLSRELDDSIANAAFIVRAVNSHDDMVAALEHAVNWAEGFGAKTKQDVVWLDQARAALAKARGEQ